MAAHFQGRLDLEKFRHFRNKSRQSLGLEPSSPCHGESSSSNISRPKQNPIAEKRKQRFEKFRERSRESSSPISEIMRLPGAGTASRKNTVEGSRIKPIVQARPRDYLTRQRISNGTSPLFVKPSRTDGSVASNKSLRTLSTKSTVALSQASSLAVSSSLSSKQDRIEQSRANHSNNDVQASRNRSQSWSLDARSIESSSTTNAVAKSESFGRHSLDGMTRASRTDRTRRSLDGLTLDDQKHDQVLESNSTSFYGPDRRNQHTDLESSSPLLDQRTVRLLYSKEFLVKIAHHQKAESNLESFDNNEVLSSENRVSCFVKKRQITNSEKETGDFDVVVVDPDVSTSVVVYQTEIKSDLKTKLVTKLVFKTDRAFSENSSSEEFYVRVCQPLVMLSKTGAMGLALVFGQYNSGVQNTMAEIEERVAFDIFEPVSSADGVHTRPASVAIQLVEVDGNACTDVFSASKSTVQVVATEVGFRIKGAESKLATCAKDLMKLLSDAKQLRSKKQQRNEGARHTVCQIFIRQDGRRGSLTLVECATTDSLEVGRLDNRCNKPSTKSLLDYIRTRGRLKDGTASSPYQSDTLAKILQHILEREDSQVSIVATVSPKATDTEKTIETLSTISSAIGAGNNVTINKAPQSEDMVLPRQWGHIELVDWLKKKNLQGKPFSSDINGRIAMRMSKLQLKNAFYDRGDDVLAERLYIALRAENDRIARFRVKRRMALEKQNSGA